jgi:hypothetical protein
MNTETKTVPALITVPADAWRAFIAAKARAAAAEKEAAAARMLLGIPGTAELVALLGATEETSAAAVIVDGNGTPIGKVSVYRRDGYVVEPGFVSKIT